MSTDRHGNAHVHGRNNARRGNVHVRGARGVRVRAHGSDIRVRGSVQTFLILLHMRNSGAENCADMGVVKGIIHLFSLAAAFNKPCGFENGKLVRNGALLHFKKVAKAAYAHFAFGKRGKNPDSGFIAENLKNLGCFFKNFFGRHISLRLFDYMGMFGVDFSQAIISKMKI